MTIQNPASPAPAATPGNGAQVVQPSQSVATPAPAQGASGNLSDGKVTIDLKEYRDLQRAKARTLSFDKRVAFKNNANQGANPNDGSSIDQAVIEATERAAAAERRAMQAEVREEVRNLLDKEEFKVLPKSTRDLILKNPAMLSSAESKDEALIDIEEFVRDQVIQMGTPSVQSPVDNRQVPVRETPPVVGVAAAAAVRGDDLEDLSKLSGTARSQASIRNAIKKAKSGIR